MDIREYEQLVNSKKTPTNKVEGLVGRILRGKNPSDFNTLTDDPSRKVVFLVDSDGLGKLPGLSGYEMLIKVGYTEDYLKTKVEEGCKFKLVVFPEGQVAKLATWDNTLDILSEVYPEFAQIFNNPNVRDQLKSSTFTQLQSSAGFDFAAIDKAGKNDPKYMTADRFSAIKRPSLTDIRAFLYFSVYLKELFTGDGYTRTGSGQRGVPEYIIPNKPIAQLGPSRIMDIEVKIPASALHAVMSRTPGKGELPLPQFFDPRNAESWTYAANFDQLLDEAIKYRKTHNIKASGTDGFRLHVLNIDDQKDFTLPQGSLYVGGKSGRGAIEDSARKAAWIYRNLHHITDMTFTLDTHFAQQIFTRSFLVDAEGNPVPMFSEVPVDAVIHGKVRPNPAMASWLCNGNYGWLCKQVEHYCKELEKKGKYTLLAWPFHCVLGSPGHALLGILQEAQMFHSFVRGTQSNCEVKGGNPLTENYSVLSPEVLTRWDGQGSIAQRNTNFIKTLLKSDAVVVSGQAASHCVKSSIEDLLEDILQQDPSFAQKCYIMSDCMSAVVTPFRDYTAEAESALAKFANAGMHLVKSTDPIETWPGIHV
jgi:nicotinamidase-related amidase